MSVDTDKIHPELSHLKSVIKSSKTLSREIVAEKVGISPAMLTHDLNGRRLTSLPNAIKIAEICGISINEAFRENQDISRVRSEAAKYELNGTSSPKHDIPLLTLQSLQKEILGDHQDEFTSKKTIATEESYDFCLNIKEFQEFEFGEMYLMFRVDEDPQIDITAIYKITNKYGSFVVIGKYYEILRAPHLKSVTTVDGKSPDIALDDYEYELIAVHAGGHGTV